MPRLTVTHSGSDFSRTLLDQCPILGEDYRPPGLWGRNGHVQTLVYSLKGRYGAFAPERSARHACQAGDGATASFDVFEPKTPHASGVDVTVCVAPGIGNSAESSYIRCCTALLQTSGFRVAVLNHLGALKESQPLTAPRIFSWGVTLEFGAMMEEVRRRWPKTRLAAVGFSMGGNLVTKFVGENRKNEAMFEVVLSICQGYDLVRGMALMEERRHHLRRFYLWGMTRNLKRILRTHAQQLFHSDEAKARLEKVAASEQRENQQRTDNERGDANQEINSKEEEETRKKAEEKRRNEKNRERTSRNERPEGSADPPAPPTPPPSPSSVRRSPPAPPLDLRRLFSTNRLSVVDDEYTRKVFGFSSLADFYAASSSAAVMDSIEAPIVYVNSRDDPLVPPELQRIARRLAAKKPNVVHVDVPFGGHLGFYEGGTWTPNAVTWIDRFIVQCLDAVCARIAREADNDSDEDGADPTVENPKRGVVENKEESEANPKRGLNNNEGEDDADEDFKEAKTASGVGVANDTKEIESGLEVVGENRLNNSTVDDPPDVSLDPSF